MKRFLRFQHVTFMYPTAGHPLFQDISLHVASGWSGVIGANGAGKTTLLKLATGLLVPDVGHIDQHMSTLYCPQRTDDVPEGLDELLFANSKSASILVDHLGLNEDWVQRWTTLSHGERKRAQIGVALWLQPDVLAIDEPTNHLDSEARDIIAGALKAFRGIGLLVSHDRDLLDILCQQCIFVDPPGVITRPGGITKAMQALKTEQAYVQRQYNLKKRAVKKLKREASRRKALADESDKKQSKRGLARRDHDGREKIDRARVTGKDGVGGKLYSQIKGRVEHAQRELEGIQIKKEQTLGIWLPGSFSKRDFLVHLPADSLPLGAQRRLVYPELVIKPADRIAVTGPNGAGKSTLIRHLLGALNVPKAHVTYVPQEIDARQSYRILERARHLQRTQLGHLMTVVSRLGSRPHRLLESDEPSPGETRKLLLAIGMTQEPHIIIMDEPTNHMDLPSITCLEEALSDCPCGLVLVSHDRRFLETLTHIEWCIARDTDSKNTFSLSVV